MAIRTVTSFGFWYLDHFARRAAARLAHECASVPAVDPTITAAWITGGVGAFGVAGTAITAWIGSRNTRMATEATIAAGSASTTATLAAAREERLWEKRAAAYEETLTGLLHRQAQRRFDLRKYRVSGEEEQRLKQFYENYELPGVFETQGRLVAYASDAVLDAFYAGRGAHANVRVQYGHRAELRESAFLAKHSGRLEDVPDADTMTDAHRQLDSALEAADAADDALIKVIRDELRSKPEAARLPAPLPAKRHKFWLRTT